MKVLGSKCKIPIIFKLMIEDGQHYNNLKRMIGDNITNFMLTKSLRELEADGLITRHDDHQVPPSVTYHLTSLGKDLAMTMNQLFDWGQELYSKKEKMVEH
ncbi:winged helix-turn-helix transcriptional regulator [Lactobacillus helveticus]|uniref:winged helix-turn-helix transcriptional regulator n=1 Tax=Lactobacillus helveticus TaxID=1587 RepID=UPI002181FA26|nr:helix-turn-helix domain-containing protein [Lactobacillus helveticus]